jgi:hypothetical protein
VRTEVLVIGTRVEKISSDATDAHGDGARGTVRSLLGPVLITPAEQAEVGAPGLVGLIYGVAWDDAPQLIVHIQAHRVREVDEPHVDVRAAAPLDATPITLRELRERLGRLSS